MKVRNAIFFLFCLIGLIGSFYFVNFEDSSSLFFYLFLTTEYLLVTSYIAMLYVGKVSTLQEERCAYDMEIKKMKKILPRIMYVLGFLIGIILFSLGYTYQGKEQLILITIGSVMMYQTLVCGFCCLRNHDQSTTI